MEKDLQSETPQDSLVPAAAIIQAFKRGEQKVNGGKLILNHLKLVTFPSSLFELSQLEYLNLDFNNLSELPAKCFEYLPNLIYLSLQGNSLADLPYDIACLQKLKELRLIENNLTNLQRPEGLTKLKSLEKLNLVSNGFLNLPEDFGNLGNLKELAIDENSLRELPNSFCKLENLERFDASHNCLTELPSHFGNLKSLRFVDLSENNLIYLPTSFSKLSQLEILDLSDNALTVLPMECESTATIRSIYLDNNEVAFLPGWCSKLPALENISIKSNSLKGMVFNEDLGDNCVKLRHLDLSGNYIECLPQSFGHLLSLEFFDMGSVSPEVERRRNLFNGNFLVKLPSNFGSLQHLKELRLDENEISVLPEEFGNLFSLEILDLSHNCLEKLPVSFCELSQLKICMLSINYIVSLPESIGKLKKLTDFRLDNNQLPSLPASFDELTKLETLDLYCNNLRELPSCLNYMVNLKRLDLGENMFGIPLSEVPDIIFKASYVVRDARKKDNWRGRKRADVLDQQVIQLLSENSIQETQFKRLHKALSQANSIWQSHMNADDNDNVVENGHGRNLENDNSVPQKHLEPEIVNHETDIPDEAFWDQDPVDPYGYLEWDKECSSKVNHVHKVIHRYKPEEVLVPSDSHAKSYRSKKTRFPEMQEGQFEDAD